MVFAKAWVSLSLLLAVVTCSAFGQTTAGTIPVFTTSGTTVNSNPAITQPSAAFPPTTPPNTTIFGGEVLTGEGNGVLNASACALTTNGPTWCPVPAGSGDIGSWINAAIAHLPLNATGCPYGLITVDPTLGPYSDATTIIKPRMVGINWNNSYVSWTLTASGVGTGTFELIGDACRGDGSPNRFTDQDVHGAQRDLFLYRGNSYGANYTSNTAVAFFFGGTAPGDTSYSAAPNGGVLYPTSISLGGWVAGTYPANSYLLDPNGHLQWVGVSSMGYTLPCTTGSTQPSWTSSPTTDGGCQWTDQGPLGYNIYGFQQALNNIHVTGFSEVISGGSNYFGERITELYASRNNYVLYDPLPSPTNAYINSGEANGLFDSFFFNNQICDVYNGRGIQWNAYNSSFDYIYYNSHTGGAGNGHFCDGSNNMQIFGGHTEDWRPPFIYNNSSAGRDTIRFYGTTLTLAGTEPGLWTPNTTYKVAIGPSVTDSNMHTQQLTSAVDCTSDAAPPLVWNNSGGTTSEVPPSTCTWLDKGANAYPNENFLFEVGGGGSRYDLAGITYNINHPVVALVNAYNASGYSLGSGPFIANGACCGVQTTPPPLFYIDPGITPSTAPPPLVPHPALLPGTDAGLIAARVNNNNTAAGGTAPNKLVTLGTAGVSRAATSSMSWFGVNIGGANSGNFGEAVVGTEGVVELIMDGNISTANLGDYVGISTAAAGEGHDIGTTCTPGRTIVGYVLGPNSGSIVSTGKDTAAPVLLTPRFTCPALGTTTLGSSGTMTVYTPAACTPSASCVYAVTNCGTAGTSQGWLSVASFTVGTSFVVNSSSSADRSTVCWRIN